MSSATPKGSLISKEFEDVYFSAQDGLAETKHVFLEGNNLPKRWKGQNHFTIGEAGFGTGLNFLATWDLFEKTSKKNQRLDFISFEKFPLTPDQIKEALLPWDFGSNLDLLLKKYPIRIDGYHKIILTNQVTLTLIIGDMNNTIPFLQANIHCWFLDGFKPSTNHEMWSNIIFENMARTSVSGTSFATFTAAGFVKRGLQKVGFEVRKVRGFGTKRDMLVGERP